MFLCLDYVRYSVELAQEYVNLGKVQKATNIYSHTWSTMKNLHISDETRVIFFLRYSESHVAVGNVLNRYLFSLLQTPTRADPEQLRVIL